jgi:hypothetical protein
MPGVLAARRRAEFLGAVGVLFLLNVLVWLVRPDWAARLGAVVVSLVVFPVVLLTVSRRRPGRGRPIRAYSSW